MSSVKEVAQQANVSVATVSRVLNQDPAVKPATRKKVLEVIEALNYKPNLMAKNLRKQTSETIVMVLPTMNNPFFAGIARGAQAAISNSGYNIIVGTTEFNKLHQLDAYVHLLKSNLADGIIFVSSIVSRELLKSLTPHYPVVLCNEYYDDVDAVCVCIDNERAGYDATRELIRRGLRSIAYLSGVYQSSSAIGRLNGYKQALEEAGIPFHPHLVVKTKSGYEQVKDAVNGILEQGCAIDGIITHSDVQATYVLKGMKEGAFTLPESLGLISFDGTFLTEITNPSLSAIAQPMYELGFTSVQMLLQKLKSKEQSTGGRVILPHRLTVRET